MATPSSTAPPTVMMSQNTGPLSMQGFLGNFVSLYNAWPAGEVHGRLAGLANALQRAHGTVSTVPMLGMYCLHCEVALGGGCAAVASSRRGLEGTLRAFWLPGGVCMMPELEETRSAPVCQ